jgi:hypothetical protein
MRGLGYDLTRHQSKALSDLPDVAFDVAVTMGWGELCPPLRAKAREDGDVPCPQAMPPEQARGVRDLTGAKVEALLARL